MYVREGMTLILSVSHCGCVSIIISIVAVLNSRIPKESLMQGFIEGSPTKIATDLGIKGIESA